MNAITFSADIVYYNENYSCDCIIDKSGDFKVLMTSPENLKDLSFEFSGESCKIMYGGMEVPGAEHFLPTKSSVSAIRNVLKAYNGAECKKDKGNYFINGDIDGNNFKLTVSPAGLPLSLEIPDLGFTAAFKNVTLIK